MNAADLFKLCFKKQRRAEDNRPGEQVWKPAKNFPVSAFDPTHPANARPPDFRRPMPKSRSRLQQAYKATDVSELQRQFKLWRDTSLAAAQQNRV
jgi:hypothetical protein